MVIIPAVGLNDNNRNTVTPATDVNGQVQSNFRDLWFYFFLFCQLLILTLDDL